MGSHRSSTANKNIGASWFLITVALLVGAQLKAQERPRLSSAYAEGARKSLLAIESDTSASQDENTWAALTTIIDATDKAAVTQDEHSITETLRRIHQLKVQDNRLIKAYGKVIEVEAAESTSSVPDEETGNKDYAVSQFTDAEAMMTKREQTCFIQFDYSLVSRAPEAPMACSEWIQRSRVSTTSH